jgi:hypothetical protein
VCFVARLESASWSLVATAVKGRSVCSSVLVKMIRNRTDTNMPSLEWADTFIKHIFAPTVWRRMSQAFQQTIEELRIDTPYDTTQLAVTSTQLKPIMPSNSFEVLNATTLTRVQVSING